METTMNKKTMTDLAYLKEISRGDNVFIREMIQVFIEETPKAINNLEQHLNNRDWKMLRAVAHKMKPSFSFVGLKDLQDIINSVEEYSETETNLDQLPEMIAKIKNGCFLAIEELKEDIKHFQ